MLNTETRLTIFSRVPISQSKLTKSPKDLTYKTKLALLLVLIQFKVGSENFRAGFLFGLLFATADFLKFYFIKTNLSKYQHVLCKSGWIHWYIGIIRLFAEYKAWWTNFYFKRKISVCGQSLNRDDRSKQTGQPCLIILLLTSCN